MENLLNLQEYALSGMITFCLGCVAWIIVYIYVLIDLFKYKNVGIPMVAIMGNFAWEINWAWFYHTNMGQLFVILYYLWFFLDCVIVYKAFLILRNNTSLNQIETKYYIPGFVFYFLGWFGFFYFFIKEYDDKFGGLSGYLINCHMSFLYLFQKVRFPKLKTNKIIAVGKCLGTALCVPVCWQKYPDHLTLKYLTILFFIIDLVYLYFVFRKNDNLEEDS